MERDSIATNASDGRSSCDVGWEDDEVDGIAIVEVTCKWGVVADRPSVSVSYAAVHDKLIRLIHPTC